MEFGRNYKEEMIATALVLSVTIVGSFLMLSRLNRNQAETPAESTLVLGTTVEQPETTTNLQADMNNESLTNRSISPASSEISNLATPSPSLTPTPSPSPSPTPTPTPAVNRVEIPYGSSQDYENNQYIVSFKDPRLIVSNTRVFTIDVVLANKSVTAGLDNSLYGVVVKNGQTISSQAPLSLSEFQRVMSGQQLTYRASITLPEQTHLTQIQFNPSEASSKVTYNLSPVY